MKQRNTYIYYRYIIINDFRLKCVGCLDSKKDVKESGRGSVPVTVFSCYITFTALVPLPGDKMVHSVFSFLFFSLIVLSVGTTAAAVCIAGVCSAGQGQSAQHLRKTILNHWNHTWNHTRRYDTMYEVVAVRATAAVLPRAAVRCLLYFILLYFGSTAVMGIELSNSAV